MTVGRVYIWAFWMPFNQGFDAIAINVATAQASSLGRVGIYDNNGNGLPGNLIVESGTLDTSTTGAKTEAITLTLKGPRRYWGAYQNDTASVTVSAIESLPVGGSGAGSLGQNALFVTHTFGAFPDPFGSPSFETNAFGGQPAVLQAV